MDLGILEETILYSDITLMNVILSIVLLLAGIAVTKIATIMFKNGMNKSNLPQLVIEFLSKFFSVLLYIAVILIFVSSLGFDVNSVVLGLSAVIGLILGFGMQDTLTNLASGIWLAALRPLDKDEFISVGGSSGTVSSVGIMATELITPDNQLITVPNKLVWGNSIINFTRLPTRRAAVDVGISYKSDLDQAIQVALDLMKEHPLVLDDPAPAVVVSELGDSSVDLQLRAWTQTQNLWTVKWDLTGGIFKAYNEKGIEIPFPQRDVHIKRD
ncbi:MscS Mechanosensitive ion channel [Methanosalsum zhilinae DSM 4017]|uniref:MscS Mechanosensitive ion channel n=1 Tax=Methanosalsum zhilinae (strain DSM 4017 / NBRC 107636 / OCM 62 / WeN5) TaxID=679901 RepID=F7XMT8_METZD|nr:mechanosensitive ion channel family protein [Methanosalsum zhilinae]AEH59955.1 MscS Mechanosensitive ion channel [Methanosalsum zhilinae DSM 4017]